MWGGGAAGIPRQPVLRCWSLHVFLIMRFSTLGRTPRRRSCTAASLGWDVRRSAGVIRLDLQLLTWDHVDPLLIERSPVGAAQLNGVAAGL